MNNMSGSKYIWFSPVYYLLLFLPFLFAALSLLGWAVENMLITRFFAGSPSMAVNTALSIIVCALGLALKKTAGPVPGSGLVLTLSLLLVLLQFTTLVSYWLQTSWSWLWWPSLLFTDSPNAPLSSPQSCLALVFLLLATALLSFNNSQAEYRRLIFVVQTLAILAFSSGLVALLGYLLTDPRYFSLSPNIGVAANTLVSIFLLSIVIFFRDVNHGLARSIFSTGIGSQVLKYFLPISLLGSCLVIVLNVAQYPGHLELLPVFASIFLIGGLMVFILILAERLNREEKIKKEARKKYETIFEENSDGMLLVDQQGIILAANQQMEELIGFPRKSLTGRAFDTLITESVRTSHLLFSKNYSASDSGAIEKIISIHTIHNEIVPVSITINKISDNTEAQFILSLRDQRELVALNTQLDELSYIATHDPLTRLPNRYLLEELSIQMFATAERNNHKVAVCFCDLDSFKQVNDDYGHQVGDALLVEMGNRLVKVTRKQDVVARLGGDEFIILFNELKSATDIGNRADSVMRKVSEPFCYKGLTINVTISMGICFYPTHGKTLNDILTMADEKLYQAKDDGKNNYKIYDAV